MNKCNKTKANSQIHTECWLPEGNGGGGGWNVWRGSNTVIPCYLSASELIKPCTHRILMRLSACSLLGALPSWWKRGWCVSLTIGRKQFSSHRSRHLSWVLEWINDEYQGTTVYANGWKLDFRWWAHNRAYHFHLQPVCLRIFRTCNTGLVKGTDLFSLRLSNKKWQQPRQQ